MAGPGRLIDNVMVHIAMHDAVQAIQQRFETYSAGITPTSGSVIAAAAKAARDVLVNRFPAQSATLDAAYSAYLAAHQISANDPGVAAAHRLPPRVSRGAWTTERTPCPNRPFLAALPQANGGPQFLPRRASLPRWRFRGWPR